MDEAERQKAVERFSRNDADDLIAKIVRLKEQLKQDREKLLAAQREIMSDIDNFVDEGKSESKISLKADVENRINFLTGKILDTEKQLIMSQRVLASLLREQKNPGSIQ